MKILTASLIFALVLVFTLAAQDKSSPAAGNAENGQKLFVKNGCYQCHGRAGQGGTFSAWTAPKLAPHPLELKSFLAYVRHPAPGGMPTYTAKVLPDVELTDIWAFLKSVPDGRPVKDIPLLNKN
jgi:mono/diheme cytochrome c family protein